MINYYTDNEGFLPSIAKELNALIVDYYGEIVELDDDDDEC